MYLVHLLCVRYTPSNISRSIVLIDIDQFIYTSHLLFTCCNIYNINHYLVLYSRAAYYSSTLQKYLCIAINKKNDILECMKYTGEYIAPTLTVDLVLFKVIDDKLNVLLLNRPNDPFRGHWALPGGYVARGETTLEALHTKMSYKINIDTNDLPFLGQLHTFDAVKRDPRGHAVSIVYFATSYDTKSTKTAAEVAFFAVDDLPKLVYDHQEIITFARKKLINELTHTDIAKTLLPPLFTMSDLQKVYEAVFGKKLDKRNFQKRLFRVSDIIDTGKLRHNVNSRPAKLYHFKTGAIRHFTNSYQY